MKKLHVIVVCLAIILIGCQRGAEQKYDGPTIGLVVMTLNNPFFIDLQNGAQLAADEEGVNLITQAPENPLDVEKQMQIVENFIQRQVDAICIAPSGSKEIIPAIVKANKANIPVLIVDSRIDQYILQEAGGKITTYIGSDNYEGGRVAGEYLSGLIGMSGKIAILEGIPGHETGDKRLAGFFAAISDKPEIKVAASQTANWERDKGFNVFQNILESHPDIEAVFAVNDMMALGAVEAIRQAGKQKEIFVIGFDAVEDAKQAIQNGDMKASVAQFPYEMGKMAVKNAVEILNGKTIPPEIPVRIELVTKDKLKTSSKG